MPVNKTAEKVSFAHCAYKHASMRLKQSSMPINIKYRFWLHVFTFKCLISDYSLQCISWGENFNLIKRLQQQLWPEAIHVDEIC